ncbi:hypothetical protein [Streptomyces lavendulae]|uniref:hypothetical protein n=1 Tax=Streptomyces lavendulae TaxID=1914 RepID=UPI00249FB6DD|nr:hypothetical protein [Streptomyces lavendulae]GLX21479.1 hypothetical protein Slala01_51230 [Streptomyces lavendulae subsp. lavendulae]GLX28896.1 hypothetical protein Slala02_47160 [Streptomyces lavendulae subsp. lavendulae]
MGTTVVGFRLGWDRKGRQATVVLTQAGVLHHGSGLLGMSPRPARPQAPTAPDPHPVPRQAATLRRVYAGLVQQGYGRELIPPVCVRLDTDERPLHPRPWGEHAPRAHPELIAEFTGAAPSGPGTLDDALTAFYAAIGLTPRTRTTAPPPPGPAAVPPAVRRALGALAEGRTLASRPGRGTGWSVTGAGVRLHAGPGGEDLTHREVAELQAALTAWLRHQRGPGTGAGAR